MSEHESSRPTAARNVGALVAGVTVVEVVFAVFLLVMSQLVTGSAATGRALGGGAFAGLVAAVVALVLWLRVRSTQAGVRAGSLGGLVWAARLLPVAALAITLVPAAIGAVAWLAVPLAFFATAPLAIVAMVVPQLLVAEGPRSLRSPSS